ncbi:alkaline-shock protein [Clostridium tetani]|uniref:Alkaline-shock protein n=2 Tax=Clostridium tetani TaxID=1513 RepID=A0A4Q0VBN7_CLOTA|nr:Asp23/Gls24 family envelope stress response protein [Clostridium tetani]CDI49320.1 asp23 protein [Clostridium tetani 12124569]AAO35798.1 putative asp23 protein [Clostridium tetani E88]AVP53687.1 Asp23/Gls24 family envelope stress response protein [Clostridium tetani]KGI38305.1 alkaline-shock protein [Clostridium tetani]KGI40180.1 alkaline-shock protein [Clostridium tetani ATCC 9441]
MIGNINNEYGYINYSEEVLGNIVGVSTMECYGVVGMASRNAKDGLWELLKGENLSKGVKIKNKEGKLYIELYIIVEYGTKISVIASNIIQKIKYNVENYTGLKVSNITVNVQGVRV